MQSMPDFGHGGYSAFDDNHPDFQEGDMIEFDDEINRVVDYDDYDLQGVLGANSDINLFQSHHSPYFQKTLMNQRALLEDIEMDDVSHEIDFEDRQQVHLDTCPANQEEDIGQNSTFLSNLDHNQSIALLNFNFGEFLDNQNHDSFDPDEESAFSENFQFSNFANIRKNQQDIFDLMQSLHSPKTDIECFKQQDGMPPPKCKPLQQRARFQSNQENLAPNTLNLNEQNMAALINQYSRRQSQ